MSAETKPREYDHSEAFALMWYACSCGHRERAWNSRDGVTPYTISCASCGGMASHADWHLDERSPDHEPTRGQLVFRNGTLAEALDIMEARYRSADQTADFDRNEMSLRIVGKRVPEFLPGWPNFHRHGFGPATP